MHKHMAQVQVFSDIGYCCFVDHKSWLHQTALKLKEMNVKLFLLISEDFPGKEKYNKSLLI